MPRLWGFPTGRFQVPSPLLGAGDGPPKAQERKANHLAKDNAHQAVVCRKRLEQQMRRLPGAEHGRGRMGTVLGGFEAQAYAILRFVSGILFAMHGSQKIFGWPGDHAPVPIASLYGATGVIELAGGLMIALGFLTAIAAFVASGEMAFAYFTSHAPKGYFPILNQGELAVLYCFLFLFIATQGAGVWSLEETRPRARR